MGRQFETTDVNDDHADVWEAVRILLSIGNFTKFSIFIKMQTYIDKNTW